jgi:hypothetical protein
MQGGLFISEEVESLEDLVEALCLATAGSLVPLAIGTLLLIIFH